MDNYKLSASSLRLLKECPKCFWLHHNKGVRRPSTPFPSLPNGMDRILKVHFDSYAEKGELPIELQKFNGDGLKLFADKKLLEAWRNWRKGLNWEDENGNVLAGAVDNILERDGKLIVLDYKTKGGERKDGDAEMNQDQLDIYNFLLKKNGYETEDYAFLIYYHPLKVEINGNVEFHRDVVKMKVSVANAERIFKNALKVLNGDMPESSKECEFCKWIGKMQVKSE